MVDVFGKCIECSGYQNGYCETKEIEITWDPYDYVENCSQFKSDGKIHFKP